MLITSRFRYAVMFMGSMARGFCARPLSSEKSPVRMSRVASDQSISEGYLEQIVADLKKAGLLTVTRGPGGGYCLSKSPDLIKLSDVVDAVGEEIKITRCGGNEDGCLADSGRCLTHNLWDNLRDYCLDYLENVTLADVIGFNGEDRRVYADCNAIAPVAEAVRSSVKKLLFSGTYNASSLHSFGQASRSIIDDARTALKKTVNARYHEAVFTASGTEANNLVMKGLRQHRHLVSEVEHVSVLNAAINPLIIPVDGDGVVNIDELRRMLSDLSDSGEGILVSVMMANNETGVIQPIKDIAKLVHEFGGLMHTDAIQALSKIPVDIIDLGVDLLTVSAHKIGGIGGAAALIFNCRATTLEPLLVGGGQEQGLRAGTENTLAIAAFAAALGEIQVADYGKISVLRDKLESDILAIAPDAVIFGKNVQRIANTSCIYMPNVAADVQLMSFDCCQIAVGSGAACSSGKVELSHVLLAMGATEEQVRCAIRVSIGLETTPGDIERIVSSWCKIYQGGLERSSSSLHYKSFR